MDSYLNQYIPVAVLFGIALFLAVLLPLLSMNLGPRRPNFRKMQPYESGMTAVGEAQRRYPVKFYRIAVLFILFDIDIILIMPWAVALRSLGLFGLGAVLIFIAVFIIGDVWAWQKGLLEWD
ncbi:MAG: NADH-quinone oxidoreductase subunit A [Anaerolineales bacterium]|nr:NADH-quinone oxidoreductase subunit A [Anaerolineales bacterium]